MKIRRFDTKNTLRMAAAMAVLTGGLAAASSAERLPNQQVFASTGQAGHALVKAIEGGDNAAMKSLLGSRAKLLESGDGLQDAQDRAHFAAKYQEMHRLVREPDGRVVLYVGAENWPFPVPLMQSKAGWYFDTDAGMEEMACRGVGANEMNAMAAAKAYARGRKSLAAGGRVLKQGYYFCAAPGSADSGRSGVVAAYPAEYRVTGVKTFLVDAKGVVYEKDLGLNTAKRVQAMSRYRVDTTWLAVR